MRFGPYRRIMEDKKQFGKNLVALLLFVALMVPTAVQFFHMFEAHEHTACSENATHVHQSATKCDVCDFHLASFNYDIAKYPDLELPKISEEVNLNFASLNFQPFKISNAQLRAPPIFS